MKIEFDPNKRAATLANRRLDFADAEIVFESPTFTMFDNRIDYGEARWITAGLLRGRMVVVWSMRGGARRIISMRNANEREQARYKP